MHSSYINNLDFDNVSQQRVNGWNEFKKGWKPTAYKWIWRLCIQCVCRDLKRIETDKTMFLLFTVPCRIFLNPPLPCPCCVLVCWQFGNQHAHSGFIGMRCRIYWFHSTVNSRFEIDNETHSKAAKDTHRGIGAWVYAGNRLFVRVP